MQTTVPSFMKDGSINPDDIFTEFFEADTEEKVIQKMDDRVKETGHKIVTRQKIGRNAACPCGSGLKFKKCCIEKMR